jgi:predicted signal transduction protein with EAL and GGDEF domain
LYYVIVRGTSILSHYSRSDEYLYELSRVNRKKTPTCNDIHVVSPSSAFAVAHKMNLEVVAVGVETDEQLKFLHSSGCDEMQGYLFSEPLSNDKFEKLVMTRR